MSLSVKDTGPEFAFCSALGFGIRVVLVLQNELGSVRFFNFLEKFDKDRHSSFSVCLNSPISGL